MTLFDLYGIMPYNIDIGGFMYITGKEVFNYYEKAS